MSSELIAAENVEVTENTETSVIVEDTQTSESRAFDLAYEAALSEIQEESDEIKQDETDISKFAQNVADKMANGGMELLRRASFQEAQSDGVTVRVFGAADIFDKFELSQFTHLIDPKSKTAPQFVLSRLLVRGLMAASVKKVRRDYGKACSTPQARKAAWRAYAKINRLGIRVETAPSQGSTKWDVLAKVL